MLNAQEINIMTIKYDMEKLKNYGKLYMKEYVREARLEFRQRMLNWFVEDDGHPPYVKDKQ